MNVRTVLCAAFFVSAASFCPAFAFAQDFGPTSDNMGSFTTTTVTNASGTIAQLNYGSDGAVDSFLLGTNILLVFPTNVAGGAGTLGAAGNSVTYSGTAITNSSGFQTVRVSSFTNNNTKATYSSSTARTTAYGPTSGTLSQLNYDANGNIDGFVFTPSGGTTNVFVATGSRASTTLQPLLTTGATVSVTGITFPNPSSACSAAGFLTVVDATSLTINGQTIVIAGGAVGGTFGGPGRHGGR